MDTGEPPQGHSKASCCPNPPWIGDHPAEIRDMVVTPGGTTIEVYLNWKREK